MKEMWDERYSSKEYAYGTTPNKFFKASLDKYKLTGSILLAAEGEGRNAVYAAKKGLDAQAFDISKEGKKKALSLALAENVKIRYEVGDISTMDFAENSFSAAALIYAHLPANIISAFHHQIIRLLKPNGIVVLEGFSKNNLPLRQKNPKIGGPDKLELLFSIESILQDFSGLEVLEIEETEIDLNEGAYHNGVARVIRFIGKKKD